MARLSSLWKGEAFGPRAVTCPQEQDLVPAVGGGHQVHSHGGVLVVGVGAHHQRPPARGVDGIEHHGVVPGEGHHVVGELLGGVHVRGEGSAGTLGKGGRRGRGLVTRFHFIQFGSVCNYDITYFILIGYDTFLITL